MSTMTISRIYTTVPDQDCSPVQQEVLHLLEKLHIPFQYVSHDPANTMEDCKAISEALNVAVCKNLFLCNRQQTEFYLLCMPADKPFKTKDLSAQIGSARLSFGSAEKNGRAAGRHSRLRLCAGADERQGEPGQAVAGPQHLPGRLFWLPSLSEYRDPSH